MTDQTEVFPMPKQPVTQAQPFATDDPDAALRILDEAWAYFTPGQPTTLPAAQYDELSVAA